uniref:BHLH domain-containing protein n=1 Tax=Plectus sambesii TaxID=2011161 RepID=A0A914UVS2_9BILA
MTCIGSCGRIGGVCDWRHRPLEFGARCQGEHDRAPTTATLTRRKTRRAVAVASSSCRRRASFGIGRFPAPPSPPGPPLPSSTSCPVVFAADMSVQVHSGFLGSTIEEKTRSLLGWTDHSRPSIVPPPVMASAVAFFETSPVQTDSRNGKKESGKRKKSIAPYHHLQRLPAAARVRKSSTSSSGSDSAVIRQLTPPPSPSGSCRSFCPTSTRRSSFDGYGPLPISPVSPNTPCPSNWKPSTRESEVFDRLRQLVPILPSDKNAYQVLIETVSSVIDLEHQLEQLSEKTEDVRNKVLRRSSDPLVGAGIHCLDFSVSVYVQMTICCNCVARALSAAGSKSRPGPEL